MKIQIHKQTLTRIPRKTLDVTIDQTIQFLKRHKEMVPKNFRKLLKSSSINLVFVEASESKRMNKQFRGKNKPTDVLSFAATDEDSIGDLVLCPSVIEEQAPHFQHTYEQELGYMVIHGVLHLLGWDHERSAREEKKMFSLQEEIFRVVQGKLR